MNENMSNIAQLIVNDENFIKTVEERIKKVLKDGKIDSKDVPQIMVIITECYNNLKKIKVSYEMLPEILEEIADYIIDTYCSVDNEQKVELKEMINMAIQLIMIKPEVKSCCTKYFGGICKK